MPSAPTTPSESSGLSSHETSPIEASVPICPNCASIAVVKHGTYTRNPHGRIVIKESYGDSDVVYRKFYREVVILIE